MKDQCCHQVLPTYHSRYAITCWVYGFRTRAEPPLSRISSQDSRANLTTSSFKTQTSPKAKIMNEQTSTPIKEDQSKQCTIFVSIPSFRDSQCQNTINSALLNAQWPNRIRFGICAQYDLQNDVNKCFNKPIAHPDQVRNRHVDKTNSCNSVSDSESYISVPDSILSF